LVVVMVMALIAVVAVYLTNKHINRLMLLVTSGKLTELRFCVNELPAIAGQYVGID
jgi:hypothetical protein